MTTATHEDTLQQEGAAQPDPPGSPQEDTPEHVDGQTLMARLEGMVRDKTRFEPSDLQCRSEHRTDQPFHVLALHRLVASVQHQDITGNFARGPNDVETVLMDSSAAGDIGERLQAATARLGAQLDATPNHLAEIPEGLYLGAARKHWHLSRCSSCHGNGKTDCRTCWGKKEEICWTCHGSLFMQCDAYNCVGGRATCTTCSGAGQVSKPVSYQVQSTQYVNGSPQTNYHTETRYEYGPCTNFGCIGGRVQCGMCTGTGRVSCTTCFSRGVVKCRDCGGIGHHLCKPCDASGEVGEAAWVEVHHSSTATVQWPAGGDGEGPRIGEKIGVYGVVAASSSGIDLKEVTHAAQGTAVDMTARYAGELAITHLDVECAGEDFHVVAYGAAHKWHDLDGIFERLLGNDLEALNAAVLDAADGGFLDAHLDKLLAALKHVAASELNAQLVESALGGAAPADPEKVVSEDYARKVNSLILGSLRHVYIRSAKQSWWKWCAGTLAVMLVAWAFGRSWWALLAGFAVLPVAWFSFVRTLRGRLNEALGGRRQAERAMAIAVRAKRHLAAAALLLAPVAIAAVLVSSVLPSFGPWASRRAALAVALPTASLPAPGQPVRDASVGHALELRASGNRTAARAMLKQLAESGDRAAAGPYAWMMFRGEGQQPGAPEAQVSTEAITRWVNLAFGANASDPWALATRGMMMAEGQGLPKDLDGGMRLLRQSADAGNAPAMHALGMYSIMVKQQPVQARMWFTRAADAGQAEDIFNLGLMEWRGEGAPRANRARAMELWKKAAAMGDQRAIRAVQLGHEP